MRASKLKKLHSPQTRMVQELSEVFVELLPRARPSSCPLVRWAFLEADPLVAIGNAIRVWVARCSA